MWFLFNEILWSFLLSNHFCFQIGYIHTSSNCFSQSILLFFTVDVFLAIFDLYQFLLANFLFPESFFFYFFPDFLLFWIFWHFIQLFWPIQKSESMMFLHVWIFPHHFSLFWPIQKSGAMLILDIWIFPCHFGCFYPFVPPNIGNLLICRAAHDINQGKSICRQTKKERKTEWKVKSTWLISKMRLLYKCN